MDAGKGTVTKGVWGKRDVEKVMLGSELWRRDAGKTIVDKCMLGRKL